MTNQIEASLNKSFQSNLRPTLGRSCDARSGDPTPKPRVTPLDVEEAKPILSALGLLRHWDEQRPQDYVLFEALLDVLTYAVGDIAESASMGGGARFQIEGSAEKLRALRGLAEADGDLDGVVAAFIRFVEA